MQLAFRSQPAQPHLQLGIAHTVAVLCSVVALRASRGAAHPTRVSRGFPRKVRTRCAKLAARHYDVPLLKLLVHMTWQNVYCSAY